MKKNQMIKNNLRSPLRIILYVTLFWLISGLPFISVSQQISQAVICSGGESLSNSTYSLEFTIGEISTEYLSNTNYILTQGFLQGTLSGIGLNEKIIDDANIQVFPNPATNYVRLNSSAGENPDWIELRDIRGSVILRIPFNTNPLQLDVSQLHSGLYTITFQFEKYQPIIKKIIKK